MGQNHSSFCVNALYSLQASVKFQRDEQWFDTDLDDVIISSKEIFQFLRQIKLP